MVDKQKDTSDADEDFESRLSMRQSMGVDQRLKNKITPIKPLASGKNRDKRPSILFSADQLGSDNESEDDLNDDPMSRMDKLLKGTNSEREGSRIINPLKAPVIPQYIPPVYNAPVYPGPPGSIPTTTLSSTTVGTPALTAPTFEYKSAYTNESYKFEGKAYGTVPGQLASSGIPSASYPIPGSNLQAPPTLPTLEKKTYTLPPSSTRNMVTPESPFTKGQAPQTTTGVGKTMNFKDDETPESGEVDAKTARKLKLQEALRLKAVLQAEKEKNDQQKISVLTPEQLEEKRRVDQEKLEQELEAKALSKLEDESVTLKAQIDQAQTEIQQYLQKTLKLNEVKAKLDQAQVLAKQKQDQAATDQQTAYFELQVSQSEIANLKAQTQNISEQIAVLKTERDANNKQISALNEQKQNIVLAMGEDDSLFNQLTEQAQSMAKNKEESFAEFKLTDSQLHEIRTTGVILDPFLSAKIDEATKKLQVAQAELSINETRLNDLNSKLEAANQLEKNQEQESEKMYTDVEVMCQAKETMVEEVKALNEQKILLTTSLAALQQTQQSLQADISIRQKYLYDVQSSFNRSSEELQCQEKIRCLLSAISALENLQSQDDKTLQEAEGFCEQEASEVKTETQQIQDFIESEQNAFNDLNEMTPRTNKDLQLQQEEIQALQAQADQASSALMQSTDKFSILQDTFSKAEIDKGDAENELFSVLTARVAIIESITQEKDLQLSRNSEELANEQEQKNRNERENKELLETKAQHQDQSQSHKKSIEDFKDQLIQGDAQLLNAHKYVKDCTDAQEEGRDGLLLLKNARLAEIAEAIATKLDAERKEAECDLEHSRVQSEIENVTIELNTFKEAKIKLEEVQTKQNFAEKQHQEWLDQSKEENESFNEQKTQLESENRQQEQQITVENAKNEGITSDIAALAGLIQEHTSSADDHLKELNSLLNQQSEFDQTHSTLQNTLQSSREEFEKLKVEKESLLSNLVETDPEFDNKINKITENISTQTTLNQELDDQLVHLSKESESQEQNKINVSVEYQELEAKLKELNEEQVTLLNLSKKSEQLSQQQSERKEDLANKFAVQDKRLQNLQAYLEELQNMIKSSDQEFSSLRKTRLVEIDEAIRDKLDSEQREAQADTDLAQLKDQVKDILAELQLTETANSELVKAKEKLRQYNEQLECWKIESEAEHQEQISRKAEVQNNQNELSQELQKLLDLQNDLIYKSEQFQLSLSEVDQHIEQINAQHIAHQTGYNDFQLILDSNLLTFQNEKNGHQSNADEKNRLLASLAETDPELSTKLIELNQQISDLREKQTVCEKESERKDEELIVVQQNHERTRVQLSEAIIFADVQTTESETIRVYCQACQSENQSLVSKSASLFESKDQSSQQLGKFEQYIQECVQLDQSTQINLQNLRSERLQEVEDAIRAKLAGEALEQALDAEITKLTDDLGAVQTEILEYESAASHLAEIQKKVEELLSQSTTEQRNQDGQQTQVDEEITEVASERDALQKAVLDQMNLYGEHLTIREQQAQRQDIVEAEVTASQNLIVREEAQILSERETLARLQGEIERESKLHGEFEDQLHQMLIQRVELIQGIETEIKLDEKIQALNEASKEEKALLLAASQLSQTEQQFQRTQLQTEFQEKNKINTSLQLQLSQTSQYEQEVKELLKGMKDQLTSQQTERLKAITEILEQEQKRLEEQNNASRAAAAVQPVNNKRRHVRNQSLIGNDLANSTFDSSQPSNLSALELEIKVQAALDRDSQGQKVTIYDLKEETKELADGGPTNDDEFFSDQMIERKRSSERGRRSSSSHSEKEQPEEGEPQSQFNKDNYLRKLRWANPTLRHIDECSEEQLVSEYGSEVGGHDFGRSGSGVFGLSTSQRLINKSTKLNQFGVVGPQQEQQENKNQHTRNESAGSVQVPISEEHVEEQSLNLTPTVPEPTIIPVARQSETRPSIFDMQRKSASQGSYRATTYDKQSSTKRMANAMRQKLGVIFEDTHYHEETVLGDLLVCLLSQKQMLSIQSDFEMNQGFALFEQMMRDDPKCHEGMFGLGRINYIQGRYELAEKWLMKAYEVKRDFAYRVWLGFSQMQLYRVCTPENPKKLKFVQNAVANLDRCAKEVKVGIYASFGLLYLSLQLQTVGLQVKGLQEPKYYEQQIRGYSTQVDKYEGELASAIIKLATNQAAVGVKQLVDLLAKDRPHAYYVLIHYYLRTNDLVKARQTADEACNKLTGYENFQERLMITLLLCKCYYKTGNHAKLLVTLQTQLLESPHFSSLLYAYGKYIIQSFKLADYLQSAISALQECMRVSCQVRRAKCAYWLSLAYQATGQLTQCGIQQLIYVNEIKQVVKSGPISIKSVKSRVNVHVQKQIKEQTQRCNLPILKYSSDVLFTTPQQCLVGQLSDPEWPNDAELTNACQRIPQQRDQLFYRAITLYKIKMDLQQADQIFISLTREHPEDFEIQSENANFLRVAIKNDYQPARQQTPKYEAIKLLEMLESCEVQGDLWANAHVQCAKLLSAIAYKDNDFNLQIKAFECLLKIKNTLPVIDTKIAAVKLPGTISRYLFDEFDHVDFQAAQEAVEEVKEDGGFKPQEDYDETNKFFSQSLYFQGKLQSCPLATLSVAEIKDQSRIKGDTVFFFGGAQTELAYQAEEATKEIQENNQLETSLAKIYYRSSTPLICVIKYLQHIRRLNSAQDSIEVLPEAVNDFGFCIYSDPSWLFIIAKMCVKWNVYIDLAVHCVQLYLQIVNYYKHFLPVELLDTKGQLLLANIILKMSTNQSEDRPVAVAILDQMRVKVSQYLTKAKETNNEKAIASALANEKFYKRVTNLLA